MERRWGLWAVIGCALLLHVAFLGQRWALERDNDTVELVLDYEAVRLVSEQSGVPTADLLAAWSASGPVSVALGGLPEPAPQEAGGPDGFTADAAGIVSRSFPSLLDEVARAAAVTERDRRLVAEVAEMGLRIAPRSLAAAEAAAAQGLPLTAYIPRGEEVEGHPDHVGDTAATLRRLGAPVGVVEFVDARGRSELIRRLDYDVVFVHSIPAGEFASLSDEQAVRRFYRAAFERQARLLYMHLRQAPMGPGLVQRNGGYIRQVADMLREAGLKVGPATAAPRWSNPIWLAAGAALAAGAGLMLVVGQFAASARNRNIDRLESLLAVFEQRLTGVALLGGPPLAILALAVLGRDALARQSAALAVAVVFPVLAALAGAELVGAVPFSRGDGARRGLAGVLLGLGAVFGLGAAGATLVAGTLGDVRFMMKLELFRGVKLAHAAPLALLTGWWLADLVRPGRARAETAAGMEASGGAAGRAVGPFRFSWLHAVLALLAAAAGFVLVARTGHDLLPVSKAERAMREWLEAVLPVRPRTKEFLLGYPALVLGLWLAARSGPRRPDRAWAGALLVAGAVAPVSIINTFAHAHISLSVSVVRSVLGLLTGGAVGIAATALATVGGRALQRVRGSGAAW